MPNSRSEDIEAIAADMSEDISDNAGLREGVIFMADGPSASRSPIMEHNRRGKRFYAESDDNYVSPSPYFIPSSSKHKAPTVVKPILESAKPTPIAAPKPAVVAPAPIFGMEERKLTL